MFTGLISRQLSTLMGGPRQLAVDAIHCNDAQRVHVVRKLLIRRTKNYEWLQYCRVNSTLAKNKFKK